MIIHSIGWEGEVVGMDNGVVTWACECGNGCRKKVKIPSGEAERIRREHLVLVAKGCPLPVGVKGFKAAGGGKGYSLLKVRG
jgi:hypothetical protein